MIEKTFIERGIRRIELEEFLKKELTRAGFTHSEIVKTPLVTRIIVNVTKPGLAIGKSGQTIRQLTESVEKRFKIDNPQIEIKEIEHPKLDAQVMVDELKAMMERGFSWRSAAYRMVRDIMGAGAQGVELVVSGKLAGKGGRKRKQRIALGYMKKIGNQTELVDRAQTAVYPKAGAIGIKLGIVRPDVLFPDKAKIVDYIKNIESLEVKEEEKPEEKTAEGEKTEGKPEAKKEGEVKEQKKTATKKDDVKEDVKKEKAKGKKELKEEKTKKKEEKKIEVKKEKAEKKKDDVKKEVTKETIKEAKTEKKEVRKETAPEKKEEKEAEKKEEKPEEKKDVKEEAVVEEKK